jgi:hypothetical protein
MAILKEAKYKAKWRRYVEESIPGPGDIVSCGCDSFRVITVIQRPDEECLGTRLHVADLEVEPIGPVEPMFVPVYERGGFYVAPLK